MSYVLLVEQAPAANGALPQPVALAAEIRGFVGESLEYGRSAFMCALAHNEVDEMLVRWPNSQVEVAKARGSQQELWTLAAEILDFLVVTEAEPHR